METIDNFYNELNTFKSRNSPLIKSLTAKKELLNDIIKDSGEEEERTWIQQKEIKDCSKHLIQIVERKDEVMNDTFTLTERILKLLKRKEILRYRDRVSDFNHEVRRRLGFLFGNG